MKQSTSRNGALNKSFRVKRAHTIIFRSLLRSLQHNLSAMPYTRILAASRLVLSKKARVRASNICVFSKNTRSISSKFNASRFTIIRFIKNKQLPFFF